MRNYLQVVFLGRVGSLRKYPVIRKWEKGKLFPIGRGTDSVAQVSEAENRLGRKEGLKKDEKMNNKDHKMEASKEKLRQEDKNYSENEPLKKNRPSITEEEFDEIVKQASLKLEEKDGKWLVPKKKRTIKRLLNKERENDIQFKRQLARSENKEPTGKQPEEVMDIEEEKVQNKSTEYV